MNQNISETTPGHSKLRRFILLSVFFAGAVLIVISIYRSVNRKVGMARIAAAQTALQERWRDGQFERLNSFAGTCDLLRQSQPFQTLAATNQLAESLVLTVAHFLQAYSQGDVVHYQRFRFPIQPTLANSAWNHSQISFYSAMASELPIDFGEAPFATSNQLVLTHLFESYPQLTQAAPGVFQTRILKSVAPEKIRVQIAEFSHPAPSIGDWALEDGGLNLSMPEPTVLYRIDTISEERGSVTIARVRLICGSTLPAGTFPVYLQFFWHGEEACFAPTEMIIPINPTELPDLFF